MYGHIDAVFDFTNLTFPGNPYISRVRGLLEQKFGHLLQSARESAMASLNVVAKLLSSTTLHENVLYH